MRTGIKICCREIKEETSLVSGEFSRPLWLCLLAFFRAEDWQMGFHTDESSRSFMRTFFSGAMTWNSVDARWFRLESDSTFRSIWQFPLAVVQPTEACLLEMRSLEGYVTEKKKNELRQRYGKELIQVAVPVLAGLLEPRRALDAKGVEFLASNSTAVVKFSSGVYSLHLCAFCSTRSKFMALVSKYAEQYDIEIEEIADEKLMPCW